MKEIVCSNVVREKVKIPAKNSNESTIGQRARPRPDLVVPPPVPDYAAI